MRVVGRRLGEGYRGEDEEGERGEKHFARVMAGASGPERVGQWLWEGKAMWVKWIGPCEGESERDKGERVRLA